MTFPYNNAENIPLWDFTAEQSMWGLAIPSEDFATGMLVLLSARLKYHALHSVPQVFDFSFPSNIAHGIGLPGCFPATSGLAGHTAPAPGRGRWDA